MGDKDCGCCGGEGALVEENDERERSTQENAHGEYLYKIIGLENQRD